MGDGESSKNGRTEKIIFYLGLWALVLCAAFVAAVRYNLLLASSTQLSVKGFSLPSASRWAD
jgi:hypothetical protein